MLRQLLAALISSSADQPPDGHWDDTAKLAAMGAAAGAMTAPILEHDPIQQGVWLGLSVGASHRGALDAAQDEWNKLHGFTPR